MKQFKSYKKTEIPLYEHCTPNSFQCAKITLLSNCTPSPLTRRGQGEVEMAHKYAFSVQKCATYFIFNRAESQIYTPYPCFVCNNVQWGTSSGKKYAFTVQKCAINLSDMKKIITNQNTHYQIPTTKYQLKICFQCAKVCNKLI